MPSSSLLASLGHADLSSASTPSKLTTRNNLDGKEKQRLLKQARKLSQILGELPQATVAPILPVRGNLTVEVPPPGFSQLHVPSSGRSPTEPSTRSPRFSRIFHTVEANTMSPPPPPSVVHDDSNRTGPKRLSSIIPANINQLDLTRFGLGHRQWSESTCSTHSDENASHTDHQTLVAETETLSDSSTNLHSLNTRPRNKARWRSVYNPSPTVFDARPRRSEDSSTMPAYSSACSSTRSVSLWTKRSTSNKDQRHTLANQSQDNTSGMHPPLTESQRIMSLRRGRKLAQVGLAEHPSAQSLTSLHRSLGQYLLSPCTAPRRVLRTNQQHQTPFRERGKRPILPSLRAISVLNIQQGTDLILACLGLLRSPFRPLRLPMMSKYHGKSRATTISCPIQTTIPILLRRAHAIGQRKATLSGGAG